MTYFSSPPSGGDRWEHSTTSLIGIALSRRQLAQQLASELGELCADMVAGLPDDCAELLRNQGRAEAWAAAVDLLSAALAEKRGRG